MDDLRFQLVINGPWWHVVTEICQQIDAPIGWNGVPAERNTWMRRTGGRTTRQVRSWDDLITIRMNESQIGQQQPSGQPVCDKLWIKFQSSLCALLDHLWTEWGEANPFVAQQLQSFGLYPDRPATASDINRPPHANEVHDDDDATTHWNANRGDPHCFP